MSDMEVINHRVSALERAVEKIGEAVEKIAENTGTLTRIEQRHDETRGGLERAFQAIAKNEADHKSVDERLRIVEVAMPGLKELRRWVVTGILAGVGMIFVALGSMVLK